LPIERIHTRHPHRGRGGIVAIKRENSFLMKAGCPRPPWRAGGIVAIKRENSFLMKASYPRCISDLSERLLDPRM
jgi:hypothetical protein